MNISQVGEIEMSENVHEETFNMLDARNLFLQNLCNMWESGLLCDVVLSVDKHLFRAHKVVLSAHSDYFRHMFSSAPSKEQTKVPLLGIKCSVVKQLLQAIYHGKITLASESVDDVLTAASYLGIDSVVQLCGKFIQKKLGVQNCLRTIQVAHMYGLPDLLESSYAVACRNFSHVTKQEKFKRMRYCEVQSMLHRQDVDVQSELQVFNAVIQWLDHDRSARLTYAGRLMRYVRFPLISESELVDKVEGCPSIEGIPEIVELIREAIRYHLLPHRKCIVQNSRTIPRSMYEEELIVCSGGLRDKVENEVMRHVYCYSENTGEWVPYTQLPEPRHHHAVSVIGGFMYIAGGSSNQNCLDSSDKVWRYDPWTDEWLQAANMHIARQSFQLGVLDSNLYAVGGRANMNDALSNVERYDPGSNKWTEVRPINSPRRHVAITALNGRLYAAGGSSSDMISRRVERFNPQTMKWEKRHPLLKPRFSASLHAVKNRLWLIGGATVKENDPGCGVTGVFDIESYSASADQWTLVTKKISWLSNTVVTSNTGSQRRAMLNDGNSTFSDDTIHCYENRLHEPRAEAGSCVVGDNIYIVAGYSWNRRSRISNVESVDVSELAINAWSTTTVRKRNTDDSELEYDMSEYNPPQISEYPVKCAGLGCCSLTVFKPPKPGVSFATLETTKEKSRPQTVVRKPKIQSQGKACASNTNTNDVDEKHKNPSETKNVEENTKTRKQSVFEEELTNQISKLMMLTYPTSSHSGEESAQQDDDAGFEVVYRSDEDKAESKPTFLTQ